MSRSAGRPLVASAHARCAADLMISHPKTLPAARATVDDVRALLGDDHVHMVLLVDGDVLVGTVLRGDVPATTDARSPALAWSTLSCRTTEPGAPTHLLRADMVERRTRRLAVVDPGGRLLGLLCLKRSGDGFCSDADVAARARDQSGRA